MFASSEFHNTDNGLKPLFAHEAPEPVSVSVGTPRDIRQYELVVIGEHTGGSGKGHGGYLIQDDTRIASNAGNYGRRLGVAAYPAKAGENVQVYVQGSFNIDALYLEKVKYGTGRDMNTPFHELSIENKLHWLQRETAGGGAMFFYALPTDKIQSK